jgi:hypothetical protein
MRPVQCRFLPAHQDFGALSQLERSDAENRLPEEGGAEEHVQPMFHIVSVGRYAGMVRTQHV